MNRLEDDGSVAVGLSATRGLLVGKRHPSTPVRRSIRAMTGKCGDILPLVAAMLGLPLLVIVRIGWLFGLRLGMLGQLLQRDGDGFLQLGVVALADSLRVLVD